MLKQGLDLRVKAPSAVARLIADAFPFFAETDLRTLVKMMKTRYGHEQTNTHASSDSGPDRIAPLEPPVIPSDEDWARWEHDLSQQGIKLSNVDRSEAANMVANAFPYFAQMESDDLMEFLATRRELYQDTANIAVGPPTMPDDADVNEWEDSMLQQGVNTYEIAPSEAGRLLADAFPFYGQMDPVDLQEMMTIRYDYYHQSGDMTVGTLPHLDHNHRPTNLTDDQAEILKAIVHDRAVQLRWTNEDSDSFEEWIVAALNRGRSESELAFSLGLNVQLAKDHPHVLEFVQWFLERASEVARLPMAQVSMMGAQSKVAKRIKQARREYDMARYRLEDRHTEFQERKAARTKDIREGRTVSSQEVFGHELYLLVRKMTREVSDALARLDSARDEARNLGGLSYRRGLQLLFSDDSKDNPDGGLYDADTEDIEEVEKWRNAVAAERHDVTRPVSTPDHDCLPDPPRLEDWEMGWLLAEVEVGVSFDSRTDDELMRRKIDAWENDKVLR